MSEAICKKYQINYRTLNLKFKEKYERSFDYLLIKAIAEQYNNSGFIFEKILRTTTAGTKINYIIATDKDMAEKKLIKMADIYNRKHQAKLTINFC